MSRYVLHAGKSIPNVPRPNIRRINEGEVYAIEPFLTLATGEGAVKNAEYTYIYRYRKRRSVSQDAAELLTSIKNNFKSLPFSPRWIKGIEEKSIHKAFNELIAKRCISSYPVLIEVSGSIVAQAEHTIVVTQDGCIITTQ